MRHSHIRLSVYLLADPDINKFITTISRILDIWIASIALSNAVSIYIGGFMMTDTFSAPAPSSAPKFPPAIAHDLRLILEHFPNIAKKITQLWGSADFQNYLNSVIFDERGGRHGFPEAVASALFRISEAHKAQVPVKSGGDIWDAILNQVK